VRRQRRLAGQLTMAEWTNDGHRRGPGDLVLLDEGGGGARFACLGYEPVSFESDGLVRRQRRLAGQLTMAEWTNDGHRRGPGDLVLLVRHQLDGVRKGPLGHWRGSGSNAGESKRRGIYKSADREAGAGAGVCISLLTGIESLPVESATVFSAPGSRGSIREALEEERGSLVARIPCTADMGC